MFLAHCDGDTEPPPARPSLPLEGQGRESAAGIPLTRQCPAALCPFLVCIISNTFCGNQRNLTFAYDKLSNVVLLSAR